MTDTLGMTPRSLSRTVSVVAVAAGLLAGAAPGPAFAGGSTPPTVKPPKCDPAVQVCSGGRKNG
jgi:hypothetical protein